MNELNELKEKLITRRMRWMRSETTSDYMISDMADLLIGITEHLEAQQLAIPRAFGPLINPDDERRGMIAALRWVCDDCKGDKSMCGSETQARCHIPFAIARLENGGDL